MNIYRNIYVVFMMLILSPYIFANEIKNANDVIKVLSESGNIPGKKQTLSPYIKKNCKESEFKHSPFQSGWDCSQPKSNITMFGVFEYLKSGYTDFVQMYVKVCVGIEKHKRNSCLIDYLKKFSDSNDSKLSIENHSLEFTKDDLKFSIGDLTYGHDQIDYRELVIYIYEKNKEPDGLGAIGKLYLQLAAINGGKISRKDFSYFRNPEIVKKTSPEFSDFLRSNPKTIYGKEIMKIWQNEDKLWKEVISKMGQ